MLDRDRIAVGLRELGLKRGDRVLVHSSMAALGPIDGGVDAVIDALLEVVGDEGLVATPTFGCDPPFDRRSSATPLGALPDRLWKRKDAVRSLHPTHSVAAIGAGAADLLRDHEKAPTAYGVGTPYHTLAMQGGKILLLGVDQDRNTTLHTAEALAEAPYLDEVEAAYIDDSGQQVTIRVQAMAGPHRDFLGLDRLFRERGIVRIGKIGAAVCRLIEGRDMIETALNAMRTDPAAVLCDNPACDDCVMQRGRIKQARLRAEGFTLAASLSDFGGADIAVAVRALKGQGILAVELTPDEHDRFAESLSEERLSCAAIRAPDAAGAAGAAQLAASIGVKVIVPVSDMRDFEAVERLTRSTSARVLMMNSGAPSGFYRDLYERSESAPDLAFSPANFARAGEKPFLEVFYKGLLRKRASYFYVDDFRLLDGRAVAPGQGNSEVKEIVSMLRCRGFAGTMTLRCPDRGLSEFVATAEAFWRLLDAM